MAELPNQRTSTTPDTATNLRQIIRPSTDLVADGGTNKEIGLRLSLSALTVKNHLARLGRKLGVRDRAQLVAVACRAGVIG